LITRKRKAKHQNLHTYDCLIHTHFVVYFHRNAVRSNAGEDRTVPHTVTLRGDAPQKYACACCFWHKIFLLYSRRKVTADIQTRTAMTPHTYSHGALSNKLDTCSRFIFQKLIRIDYWNENEYAA